MQGSTVCHKTTELRTVPECAVIVTLDYTGNKQVNVQCMYVCTYVLHMVIKMSLRWHFCED